MSSAQRSNEWDIHTDTRRPIPAEDLATVLAFAEACQQQLPAPPDATWVENLFGSLVLNRTAKGKDSLDNFRGALRWYVMGGFDCINPILRHRDPARLVLPGHRNDQWLRERVRDEVRRLDSAPTVSFDHDVTIWRGVKHAKSRNLPSSGQLLADRAFTSCSLRRDVAEQAGLRYVERDDYRPYYSLELEIRVPAGTAIVPAYWMVLEGGAKSYFLPMELNEVEVLLGRNADLRLEHVKKPDRHGVIRARAVVELRKSCAPSSEILPAYEQQAIAA